MLDHLFTSLRLGSYTTPQRLMVLAKHNYGILVLLKVNSSENYEY